MLVMNKPAKSKPARSNSAKGRSARGSSAKGKPARSSSTTSKPTKSRPAISAKPLGKEVDSLPKDEEKSAKNNYRPRSGSPSLDKKYASHKLKEKLPDLNREDMRLNKFLSNAGIASRRQADVLIESGNVSVNGVIVTELGYRVKPTDDVKYDGARIKTDKKRYVLLNKPKDFVTTLDDPTMKKSVMTLVAKACKEIVYPVGMMEKETMGVLLFTNDSDLMKILTHPKNQVKKMYHVEVERPFSHEDIEKLRNGVRLGDGVIKCDHAEYVKNGKSTELGIEVRSGKNKIVRRMIEKLGYTVVRLDRVQYAGLTKKDLPRGMYRQLSEREVAFLKMIS